MSDRSPATRPPAVAAGSTAVPPAGDLYTAGLARVRPQSGERGPVRQRVASTGAWWALAALATTAAIVIRVIVAQSAVAPRAPWDEIGILAMAKLIAGVPHVTLMSGAGYYPGYSFLLAPIWWVTDDPRTVYVAAVVVGNVLSVATIWPIATVARRLGLGLAPAITVGAIVACLPSRTALGDYVLADQLLGFLLAWVVAAAFWVWARPTVPRTLIFVALVSAAHLTHIRALVAVVAAGVWLVCLLRRRIVPALVGLAALVAGYFAVRWLVGVTTARILLNDFGQEGNFLENLRTTWPELFARVTVAHTWAQLVATLGLALLGALVIIAWSWQELRRFRTVGPVGFVLGLVLLGTAVGILGWVGPAETMSKAADPRFDVWIYTRYLDSYAALAVAFALIALFRVTRLGLLALATVLGVTLSLIMIFAVAPIVPTYGSNYGPGNTAGVQTWSWLWPRGEKFRRPLVPTLDNPNRFFWWASIAVLATSLVLLVLRRWAKAVALFLTALLTTAAIIGNPEQGRDTPDKITAAVVRAEQLTGRTQNVDVDVTCRISEYRRAQALNWVGYWLGPRQVDVVSNLNGFHDDLVLACIRWSVADDFRAVPVDGTQFYGYQLYVMPGATQDAMRRDGMIK